MSTSAKSSIRRESPDKLARSSEPIKFALLSSGLGRVNRGFELTTNRWHQSIKASPHLACKLYAGGPCTGALKIWNLPREILLGSPLKHLRRLNERALWEFCYVIEQITFSVCLKDLLVFRPDVVWTKEIPLAHFLLAYKYLFNLKYKIIFANGGAFKPSSYQLFDYIQHLHPDSLLEACQFGLRPEKMQFLPNCVFYQKPKQSKGELRRQFGFGDGDFIIICVAAWNSFQKRLDYLIEEVAALADERIKLLLVGQPELETDDLKRLGKAKLGNRVRWLTLAPEEVYSALALSDLFVLSSFREGLSSSIIEAAMAGLPILSHPHAGGRYVLEDNCWLVDMSVKGDLKNRIKQICENGVDERKLALLQEGADQRFSSAALTEPFINMVQKVNNLR